MSFLYNIFIYIYWGIIQIASLFNPKAKLWIKGRKNIFQELDRINPTGKKLVWFHAASLGEFEQGRPIIEGFRKKFPDYKILLTFFSPSGYEPRKKYEYADFICYMPIDTFRQAKRFIDLVKPDIVFFIKYEFWFNYLKILSRKHIPVYIISAIFRKEQHFFKPYGFWFRKQLNCFTHFFVQNENSKQLLDAIGFKNVTVSGDTRFDRVFMAADQKKAFPLIEQFKGASSLFVAGSSWSVDEYLIKALVDENMHDLKFLIAPHEIHKSHIDEILKKMTGRTILFSQANETNIHNADILIIDSIGILLHLYQYATITYIGGGFGKSIHNILESAAFGNPVLFGPNHTKFQEADDLIKQGGGFCINDSKELIRKVKQLLEDKSYLENTSSICSKYVLQNKGATEIILQYIVQNSV